jgi:hypothetical protein
MSIASTILAGAKQALSIGGSTGTLVKTSQGAYNPATGQAAETTESFAVQVSNIKPVQKWEGNRQTLVEVDEIMIGLHGLTVVPQPGDRVTINGTIRTLATVQTVQAQNITVLYRCELVR